MKSYFFVLLQLVFFGLYAQKIDDYTGSGPEKMYKVLKQNGSLFIGKIISQDAREVLIETRDLGKVYIPRHEIKEMTEIRSDEVTAKGEYIAPVEFSSRYFFTTNGLPIKKGEGYVKWSLLGPDIQFAVAENVGVGIITTWAGFPLVASLKYSIKLKEDVHMGVGALLGSGSWLAPGVFAGLPFAAITLGDARNNINFSLGYGGYRDQSGYLNYNRSITSSAMLCSVAAYARLSNKVAFVFDSFILPLQSFGFLTPGLRFGLNDRTSFQLGFTGLVVNGNTTPVPIPNFQLFQKF